MAIGCVLDTMMYCMQPISNTHNYKSLTNGCVLDTMMYAANIQYT